MRHQRLYAGTDAVRLFAYGSLLPGLSNHPVIEPYLLHAFPGKVGGELVDVGPYPAMMLRTDRFVRGMWMDVRRAGLPALDELEGFAGIEERNDYERVWVKDAVAPGISGWTYVWPDARGYPPADADWWPDALARKTEDYPEGEGNDFT
ncbi:gamma-glutamylcyclotransferase [Paenibacillaceae bacterium WGS1546]|uniref:gamma-glutamylcyclotransferase family protein n=1 Tax=Cohnella sp. WGS1546 TaxID=3366810 RepID=UPI00372D379E